MLRNEPEIIAVIGIYLIMALLILGLAYLNSFCN